MLDRMHKFHNPAADEFNMEMISSSNDIPITDLIISTFKEFEAISNIKVLSYEIIDQQDQVDINEHKTLINFKKKDLNSIEIPKFKYMTPNRYGEIRFKVQLKTNLEETVIEKKILYPIMYEGYYLINGKKMRPIWQLCDAAVYSQRGRITLKSRMPIILYSSKRPEIDVVKDIDGNIYPSKMYSYAIQLKGNKYSKSKKKSMRFINPMLIYIAKAGFYDTLRLFHLEDIIELVDIIGNDKEHFVYVKLDELYIKVNKYIFLKFDYVKSIVGMLSRLNSNTYPISRETLNQKVYWYSRLGADKNNVKNLYSFEEKGRTTILRIERLLNNVTISNLKLPEVYRNNIYCVLKWMITNFDVIKNRSNMDLENKRLRKNEYIVESSLGKRVSEGVNKIVEKLSKSRSNTMPTLKELFNFNSDIIVSNMRNLSDVIKSDEYVNDMTFSQIIAYSSKGPNSLGEQSTKAIRTKYRNVDPSYVGRLDLNTSSNSDCGLSGSLVPFVELHGLYFSGKLEPCEAEFNFFNALSSDEEIADEITDDNLKTDDFDEFVEYLNETIPSSFKYETLLIVEKEPSE